MADPDPTKPFDFAQDVTKQVLTLSTGVVTITIALLKDIVTEAPGDARTVLYIGWALFGLAILAGVCTLLNLTGRVGSAAADGSPGIDAGSIRLFSIAQLVAFVLAMGATVYFGARAFEAQADCEREAAAMTTTNPAETETPAAEAEPQFKDDATGC